MNRRAFLLGLTASAVAVPESLAQTAKAGDVTVSAIWSRATPRNAPVGLVYMTLTNAGKSADKLVAVSTPAAAKSEIHEMRREGDVMVMRPMPQGLEIKPGDQAVLSPGGNHLMLIGLVAPLVEGQSFHLMLTFASGAMAHLDVPIMGMGAQGPGAAATKPDAMQDHNHH